MNRVFWLFMSLAFAQSLQAQTVTEDFEFDFAYPTDALSIVGVYAKEGGSCTQVMVTGHGAEHIEFPVRTADEHDFVELTLQSLCLLVFTNLDRQKTLELRLSTSFQNFAQIFDERLVSTGLVLLPGHAVSITIKDEIDLKLIRNLPKITTGFEVSEEHSQITIVAK